MPHLISPLNANPIKWPNTLKQFVGKLPTNCLSVFGHFVNLALKGLVMGIWESTNMSVSFYIKVTVFYSSKIIFMLQKITRSYCTKRNSCSASKIWTLILKVTPAFRAQTFVSEKATGRCLQRNKFSSSRTCWKRIGKQ